MSTPIRKVRFRDDSGRHLASQRDENSANLSKRAGVDFTLKIGCLFGREEENLFCFSGCFPSKWLSHKLTSASFRWWRLPCSGG